MPSTTQDTLYEDFTAIAGEQVTSLDTLVGTSQDLAVSLTEVVQQFDTVAKPASPASQGSDETTAGLSDIVARLDTVTGPAGPTETTTGAASSTAATLNDVAQQISTATAGSSQEATAQGQATSGMLGSIAMQIGGAGTVNPATSQTSTSTTTGGGVLDTVESVASKVFTSGLGLVPLISGLAGLFGGGDSTATTAPLEKYALPPSIAFAGAETDGSLTGADFDQMGLPRAYSSGGSVTPQAGAGTGIAAPVSAQGSQGSPQITVNVQAMDSRSFLDHSNDIAAAVRDAMLNLNAINDVVNDL